VRFLGVIPNTVEDVAKMAKRLAKHGELDFCYEAGGCGYVIHRQLTALGHNCMVVAPSIIPRKPGARIKTDRRDSEKLAILHRAGDLTPVWVPDTTHEALRDLVRARVDASMHLMRARQQLLAFLLRHGRSYPTGKHWTQRHRSWLAGQTFHEHAHGIVFQDYLETVWTAQQRAGRTVMVILESPLWQELCSDARAKSEAGLRRHTFVRYPTPYGSLSDCR
jgi:transposase